MQLGRTQVTVISNPRNCIWTEQAQVNIKSQYTTSTELEKEVTKRKRQEEELETLKTTLSEVEVKQQGGGRKDEQAGTSKQCEWVEFNGCMG